MASTIPAILRESCRTNAALNAMAMVGKDGEVHFTTYAQLWERIRCYAGALRGLGLQRGDKICILSENCPEWSETDFGGQTLGVVVVPIYPTLPADQAQYIVKDCQAKLVEANGPNQIDKVKDLPGVRVIPMFGEGSITELASSSTIGDKEWNPLIDSIGPEDVATIIYTSGTTGLPKGAMLPHRAFDWIVKAVLKTVPFSNKDTFLSFLPISHVFERVNGQFLALAIGVCIGSTRSLASVANDFQKIQPTVMLTVPRFLDSMRDRILDGVAKQKPIQQKLFRLALAQGTKKFKGEFAPLFPITNKLVGPKIRARLGGRFRFFVSGGAALPAQVAEFYGAFGIPILQGFGLTETCSGVVLNPLDRSKYWTVGEVFPGMECRIAEDGEILLRGPAIMLGYWNLPEETAAAIDTEGWFHTGDIGAWEGTYLKITDRKKDLIVLGNGKNVAPQPIENKLRTSHYIEEAVVLGDGMDSCIALIVPAASAIRNDLKVPEETPLQNNPQVKALIKSEVDKINKTLAGFEMIKRHAILPRSFSIDEGELTPSMKVKRKVIKEKYASLISEISG